MPHTRLDSRRRGKTLRGEVPGAAGADRFLLKGVATSSLPEVIGPRWYPHRKVNVQSVNLEGNQKEREMNHE
jgi:hypothetical protein